MDQIQFHRLHSAGKSPTSAQLKEGGIVLQMADGLIYTKDKSGNIISMGGGGGGAASYTTINANIKAERDKGYLVKTSKGRFDITLPSKSDAIANGTSVSIGDYDGEAFNNNITIKRNGATIMGVDEDFIFNVDYATITLVYVEAENDWRIVNGAGETSPPSFISEDKVFTNVAGQSSFAPDAPLKAVSGDCDVYYNSGRLVERYGYNIQSNGSISLTSPVTIASDIITVRVYNRAEVANFKPINDAIAKNKADISTNKSGVATNKTGVSTNKSGVATNKTSITNNKKTYDTFVKKFKYAEYSIANATNSWIMTGSLGSDKALDLLNYTVRASSSPYAVNFDFYMKFGSFSQSFPQDGTMDLRVKIPPQILTDLGISKFSENAESISGFYRPDSTSEGDFGDWAIRGIYYGSSNEVRFTAVQMDARYSPTSFATTKATHVTVRANFTVHRPVFK